jgi:hypothetical protein
MVKGDSKYAGSGKHLEHDAIPSMTRNEQYFMSWKMSLGTCASARASSIRPCNNKYLTSTEVCGICVEAQLERAKITNEREPSIP